MNKSIELQAVIQDELRRQGSSNAEDGRDGFLFDVGGHGTFATQILVQDALICPSIQAADFQSP